MRNKLRNMVDRWAEQGLVVEVTLVNGVVLRGRVIEIDNDEMILEPIYDGEYGSLVVIQVAHLVTVTYTDDDLPAEDTAAQDEPDLPPAPIEHL
jgi:hypothetical protein